MNKFYTALAAVLFLSSGVTSGFASTNLVATSGGAPRCESNAGVSNRSQLADQLQLANKLSPTIDVWNGCLKVTYSDADGHWVTTFYDPDTLSPIRGLN